MPRTPRTSLLSDADLAWLQERGITREEAERQLNILRQPPPPVELVRPCTPGDGIRILDEGEQAAYRALGEAAAREGRTERFVPASGAATRMFRDLIRFWKQGPPILLKQVQEAAAKGDGAAGALLRFLDQRDRFAFRDAWFEVLEARGVSATGEDLHPLLDALLSPEGLDYARAPKALILFHRYADEVRTAFAEHLVEGAHVHRDGRGWIRTHFTIPISARGKFESHRSETVRRLTRRFGARFTVDFSHQDPATDTLALGEDGRPFRLEDGRLLLRPSGHGALLRNLQALGGDLVFLKNIDNVAHDRHKAPTYHWAPILTGMAAQLVETVRSFLRALEANPQDARTARQAVEFAERILLRSEGRETVAEADPVATARRLLHRPLRVCGMVRNVAEPGGGPFWVRGRDGSLSIQIVETAQVDPASEDQQAILRASTHFNPVFMVCSLRDHHGRPFRLENFVDSDAVILTKKTAEGRPLLALERPGLWNGSMAGWNTVFVEVPQDVFHPVKTVLDLLRPGHQPE